MTHIKLWILLKVPPNSTLLLLYLMHQIIDKRIVDIRCLLILSSTPAFMLLLQLCLVLTKILIELQLLKILIVRLHLLRIILHLSHHLRLHLQHHRQVTLVYPRQHRSVDFTGFLGLVDIDLSLLLSLLHITPAFSLLFLIEALVEP